MAAEMYAVESVESRNRNLQIAAEERARNPQVIAQREAEDRRQLEKNLEDSIDFFLGTFRGQCRAAAGRWANAKALAESTIRKIDTAVLETKNQNGLLGIAAYLDDLDQRRTIGLLKAIADSARDEEAIELRENRQRREAAWATEARDLGLRRVVEFVEKNAGLLVISDGRLAFKGAGTLDPRAHIYLSTIGLAEVKQLIEARETIQFIEQEKS